MNYYVASQSGNVLGPYGEKEIVDLVTDGLLNVEDRCTPEGEENWKPLATRVPAVWTSPNAKLRPRARAGFKKCPTCDGAFAESALTCPRCHATNKSGIWRVVLFVVIVLSIISAVVAALQSSNRTRERFEQLKREHEEVMRDGRSLLGK